MAMGPGAWRHCRLGTERDLEFGRKGRPRAPRDGLRARTRHGPKDPFVRGMATPVSACHPAAFYGQCSETFHHSGCCERNMFNSARMLHLPKR